MVQTSEWYTLMRQCEYSTKCLISPQYNMSQKDDERNIILALQAMKNDPNLSARAAGKIYTCNHQKLGRRMRSMQSRCDIQPNSQKLSNLEESVLVQYILDLATKGFPLQISIVEDIANRLLTIYNVLYIGSH